MTPLVDRVGVPHVEVAVAQTTIWSTVSGQSFASRTGVLLVAVAPPWRS